MRKYLPLLVTVFIVVIVLSGCGRKDEHTMLRQVVGPEPQTLDPRLVTQLSDIDIDKQLFEGLVTVNEQGNIVPAAAIGWEIENNGLRYTFHLRDGLKWSDGSDLTASDFEYAWKSALSSKTAATNASLLFFINGAEAFNRGQGDSNAVGVKAKDSTTLVVDLAKPCPYFLSLLMNPAYFPVSQQVVAANAAWAGEAQTLVSNGPFRMKAWQHGGAIEMARNEYYWDKNKVRLEKVKCILTDNSTTALAMLESGEIDISGLLPPSAEMPRLDKESVIKRYPMLNTYYLAVNVSNEVLKKRELRQALALAIDRQNLLEKVTRGGEQAAWAWVPYGVPDATSGSDFRKTGGNLFVFDVNRARELLAEAGYPGGNGMPPITLLYNTSESNKAIVEALQAMWRDNLGITVNLVNQENKVVQQSIRQGEFELVRASWVGDYLDPMTYMTVLLSNNPNNKPHYKNMQYDALVEKAADELNGDNRMKLLHEAENILISDMPLIPIYFGVSRVLESQRVHGVVHDALGGAYLKTAYLQ